MAFTAKILSWRFRHLNIVGCLLKRRPTKGGSRAPQDPPLATPLILYLIYIEKTVYIKTHKTAINRAVDYTGWRSKLPAWKGWKLAAKRSNNCETDR